MSYVETIIVYTFFKIWNFFSIRAMKKVSPYLELGDTLMIRRCGEAGYDFRQNFILMERTISKRKCCEPVVKRAVSKTLKFVKQNYPK